MTATYHRRYIFKLHPTAAQAAVLHEHRKMMADLWNALKQRREDVYSREHKSLTFFDLTNEITELRHQCPEWAAIPAITAHRVAKRLTDAYAAFFRRVKAGQSPGYPRWQRREQATTISLGTMGKTGWRIEQRSDNPVSWSLHYGGVSNVRDRATWIHARGRIPTRRDSESSNRTPNRLGGNTESSSESRRVNLASNTINVTDWRNADIIWRDGNWWLSVCVEIESRREPGRFPVTVSFDLIDDFARVNGIAETPKELIYALAIQDDIDRLKSERDTRWPRGRKLSDDERTDLAEANLEISSLSAFVARKRRNAIHVWSAGIVARASDLTIIAPPVVRDVVKTPRGDEKRWGAAVETVSGLNRHVLSQAPATAIQLLRYKAEEAGIRCDVVSDDAPKIAVGGDLVTAGKELRRARRQIRRAA